MQIQGLQAANATQSVQRSNAAKPTGAVESAPAVNAASADQLDLSPEAQAIVGNQGPSANDSGIRTEKVAAIRQAIADGTYETQENLSAALDNLLDSFA